MRETQSHPGGVLASPSDDEIAESGGTSMSGASGNNKVVRQVEIVNKLGLHARPAMQFVDLANTFSSRIEVRKGQQSVNAKSIMELLLLAAGTGTQLTIEAEGPDADAAVSALEALVDRKFDED